jgi:hypothetical protein
MRGSPLNEGLKGGQVELLIESNDELFQRHPDIPAAHRDVEVRLSGGDATPVFKPCTENASRGGTKSSR